MDALKADRDKRLAAEQKKAAEEKAAAAEQAKKTRKIAMIAVPVVVAAVVAAVLISNFVKAQQEDAARLEAYNAAATLAEAGQYEEAIAAFTELGDYKDSETMRKLCEDGEVIVTIAFSRIGMFGDDSAETFDVVYHTQAEMFLIDLYFDKIMELTGCSPDEAEGLKEELSYLLADMNDEVAACSGNHAAITVYDTSAKENIVFQI